MLINLRNALMAGRRLPYDSEVECLQSTGTQYINTGVLASAALNDAQIDITYSSSSTSGDLYIFGGGNTFNTAIQCVINSSSKYFQPSWGQSLSIPNGYAANAVTTLRMTYDDYALAFNTTTKTGSFTATSRTFNDRAIYLFRGNRTSGGINTKPVRIYAFKISRNGVAIQDFIPVRKGTVGYLYDRVSGNLFGNAGTGDFVLGQDVVPVEYIESTGTQWIDTGVVPASTSRMVADIKFEGSANMVSGVWGSSGRFQFGIVSGVFTLGIGSIGQNGIAADTLRHTVILDAGTKTANIDGNQYSLTSASISFAQYTIPIFAQRYASNTPSNYCRAKLYGYKLFNNGVLVRDYQPIRVGSGSTWEGALLDNVSRKVYRNVGTGDFGYGNDK